MEKLSKQQEAALLRRVREYHDEVVKETNIIDPNRMEVEYKLSNRMTRTYGATELVYWRGRQMRCRVTLSVPCYLEAGWEMMAETIRHELIHVWQHQKFGINLPDYHGETFQSKMELMDVKDIYGGVEKPKKRRKVKAGRRLEPRYRLDCPNCGVVLTRKTMNPLVKQSVAGKPIGCGRCKQEVLWKVTDLKTGEILFDPGTSPKRDEQAIKSKKKTKRLYDVTCPMCSYYRQLPEDDATVKAILNDESVECPDCGMLSHHLLYDHRTGRLVNKSTWNYWTPDSPWG